MEAVLARRATDFLSKFNSRMNVVPDVLMSRSLLIRLSTHRPIPKDVVLGMNGFDKPISPKDCRET